MQEPVILLLEDFDRDAGKVHTILRALENMKVIGMRYQKTNTLGFFSDQEGDPSLIVMFLDREDIWSVEFSSHSYFLRFEHFGLNGLFTGINLDVKPVASNDSLDLLELVRTISTTEGYNLCLDN
jgi:hypothetical protein